MFFQRSDSSFVGALNKSIFQIGGINRKIWVAHLQYRI
jgi:hypothetical protein